MKNKCDSLRKDRSRNDNVFFFEAKDIIRRNENGFFDNEQTIKELKKSDKEHSIKDRELVGEMSSEGCKF